MEEKYEVKNEEIQALLKKLANFINGLMPKGWGFTLLIFDYSKDEKDAGSMFYISSAGRKDMVKAMMEFVDKQQEDQPTN